MSTPTSRPLTIIWTFASARRNSFAARLRFATSIAFNVPRSSGSECVGAAIPRLDRWQQYLASFWIKLFHLAAIIPAASVQMSPAPRELRVRPSRDESRFTPSFGQRNLQSSSRLANKHTPAAFSQTDQLHTGRHACRGTHVPPRRRDRLHLLEHQSCHSAPLGSRPVWSTPSSRLPDGSRAGVQRGDRSNRLCINPTADPNGTSMMIWLPRRRQAALSPSLRMVSLR
jgi:hypothetical protein